MIQYHMSKSHEELAIKLYDILMNIEVVKFSKMKNVTL
jgi:hypothetical protein